MGNVNQFMILSPLIFQLSLLRKKYSKFALNDSIVIINSIKSTILGRVNCEYFCP